MDLRALAELIMMTLFGLSALAVAVGFSVRVFIAPVAREWFERLGGRSREETDLLARELERLGGRLEALEGAVERIGTAQDFERQLAPPAKDSPAD